MRLEVVLAVPVSASPYAGFAADTAGWVQSCYEVYGLYHAKDPCQMLLYLLPETRQRRISHMGIPTKVRRDPSPLIFLGII